MDILKNLDERAKKFGILDLELAQGAAIFAILIIVKLVPQIMSISIWWFVLLLILCGFKPFYVFWIKK